MSLAMPPERLVSENGMCGSILILGWYPGRLTDNAHD